MESHSNSGAKSRFCCKFLLTPCTIRTRAVCVHILLSFSEKWLYRLLNPSYSCKWKGAAMSCFKRFQQRVKRRNLSTWDQSHEVCSGEIAQKLNLFAGKMLPKTLFFWQFKHFKRFEVVRKRSVSDVWPTFRCARIPTFQRTLNYCRTTNLRGWGANSLQMKQKRWLLNKMSPQSPKKWPEYGLYCWDRYISSLVFVFWGSRLWGAISVANFVWRYFLISFFFFFLFSFFPCLACQNGERLNFLLRSRLSFRRISCL